MLNKPASPLCVEGRRVGEAVAFVDALANTGSVQSPAATSHPESLSGLIESVTFFSEETGFAVLNVKVKGHRDLIKVVGALAAANAGEWVTAEGRGVRDKHYGLQFRADRLNSSPPTSREGIEKYLASGMVKGIGPVYAKRLVEKFGEGIFDIIDTYSVRLEEVDGIGPGRRKTIKTAWSEQKSIRQIMVFLHSQGVSTSRAVRIYKQYGEEAIDKVRSNPYALARDIPGIGFKTADQIAGKIGIPGDSLLRACAGLSHVLLDATQQGHCALPLALLKEKATDLLQVAEAIVNQALDRALANRDLVVESLDGESLVFLPHLSQAEVEISIRIKALCAAPPQHTSIDFDKAIAWCQQKTGKELAASQLAALRTALSSRMVIITGGPGVGKTTLVNALLLILRAKGVSCLLCAPTGRAAKRLSDATGLEARTIHRLLEVNRMTGGFMRTERNPLEADLLVVDECSMVDVVLMDRLLRALPARASLVLVGDVDQLPSVGPGIVLGHLIQSGLAPVVRLTEVFRQAAHSQIITNAHRINQGSMPVFPEKNAESDFYLVERDEPEQIAEAVVEMLTRRIPARFKLDPA